MLHIDLMFVGRAGAQLLNFKQKSPYLFNASCPVCGDWSETKRRRGKRLFIYRPPSGDHLAVKCHKCGYSVLFSTFLREHNPNLHKEYVLEKYKGNNETKRAPKVDIEKLYKPTGIPMTLVDATLDGLKPLNILPSDHEAVQYIASRQIPKDKWSLIYYTDTFKSYVNGLIPGKLPDAVAEHARIVLPYFTDHGKVYAFSARALDPNDPKRYYTIKLDELRDRIYGLDRIDKSKTILAVEGQFDSLLLDNAIAVSGSNFDCDTIRALKSRITLVPDNEPRSKTIIALIKKHIGLGYRVCLFPSSMRGKDINEMILNGHTIEEIHEIIKKHTYAGAVAQLAFANWRKVA